jgi:hypothetical protein
VVKTIQKVILFSQSLPHQIEATRQLFLFSKLFVQVSLERRQPVSGLEIRANLQWSLFWVTYPRQEDHHHRVPAARVLVQETSGVVDDDS